MTKKIHNQTWSALTPMVVRKMFFWDVFFLLFCSIFENWYNWYFLWCFFEGFKNWLFWYFFSRGLKNLVSFIGIVLVFFCMVFRYFLIYLVFKFSGSYYCGQYSLRYLYWYFFVFCPIIDVFCVFRYQFFNLGALFLGCQKKSPSDYHKVNL